MTTWLAAWVEDCRRCRSRGQGRRGNRDRKQEAEKDALHDAHLNLSSPRAGDYRRDSDWLLASVGPLVHLDCRLKIHPPSGPSHPST